jgi:hypothetical protein
VLLLITLHDRTKRAGELLALTGPLRRLRLERTRIRTLDFDLGDLPNARETTANPAIPDT